MLIIYCVIKNFVRFIISVYLSTLTVRVLPAWLISDSLICDCLVCFFSFYVIIALQLCTLITFSNGRSEPVISHSCLSQDFCCPGPTATERTYTPLLESPALKYVVCQSP